MSDTGRHAIAPPTGSATLGCAAVGRRSKVAGGRHSSGPVRRSRSGRLLVGGVALLAVCLSAGTAYAWWSATGSGSGSAEAGTLLPLEVSHNAVTPTTRLMPGQTGSVVLLVHNPNPVPVELTTVARDTDPNTHALLPISVSGGAGCTTDNSGLSFTDQTGLTITIAAGVEWQEIELPDAMVMDLSSADGCQGASFAIPVTLTVRTP